MAPLACRGAGDGSTDGARFAGRAGHPGVGVDGRRDRAAHSGAQRSRRRVAGRQRGAQRTRAEDQGDAVLHFRRWPLAAGRPTRGPVCRFDRRAGTTDRGSAIDRRAASLRAGGAGRDNLARPFYRAAGRSLRRSGRRRANQASRWRALRTLHYLLDRQRTDRQSAGHHPRADPDRRQRGGHAGRTRGSAPSAAEKPQVDRASDGYRQMTFSRSDARTASQLRPTRMTPSFSMPAEGSGWIESGKPRVSGTASVEDRVPPFLRNSGKGWVTAEYGMLPRATSTRTQRESSTGKVGGRTQEIQRLIGRSLRSITRRNEIGERTIWIDCDVIQADGGTRTASITGGFVALVLALQRMRELAMIKDLPIVDYVAATSVGIVGGAALLDLAYEEDSKAEVDMNFVKTGDGRFIELQGTAEGLPFDRHALDALMGLADDGIKQLIDKQRAIVGAHLGK